MFTRERLTRWTAALRANPEQQQKNSLANADYTKFCCLGKLCEVEGIRRTGKGGYLDFEPEYFFLPNKLRLDFGTSGGWFWALKMPALEYNNTEYASAAQANDEGVPWPIIADHFDKYYPCRDEQQEIN